MKCQRCGAPLDQSTADVLCPACLLRAVLDTASPEGVTSATTPVRLALPRSFGTYELIEELGRGGMGVVYRARQGSLDRVVAVKLLLAGAYSSEAALRRFQLEAAAAAGLQHPSIVAIHDYGEVDGQPYYAMDLVAGQNLAELCAGRPLPARQAAEYLRTLAGAVEYAHRRGILHRDLKPSNVLVDEAGRPRITDFGLVKLLGSTEGATMTGQMLGSPSYAAPEQAAGRFAEIGVTSDLYGLGALFYHLVTGRAPFNAATPTETLRLVLDSDPPPPRLLNPSLPRDLETICLKCLAKDPVRRYATAAEVVEEVERFLAERPIHAQPPSQRYRLAKFVRRHRVGVAAVAAIALSLVAGLITASTLLVRERVARRDAVTAEASASLLRQQAETARQLETKRGSRTALVLSEQLLGQGRTAEGLAWLVHAARKDPGNRTLAPRLASILAARNFFQQEGAPLQLGSRVLLCEFSPDGQRLRILCEDGTLAAVDLTTGEVRRGKSPSPPTSAQWVGATEKEGALLCADGVVRVFAWDTMQPAREIRLGKKGMWARPAENDRGLMLIRLEDHSWTLVDLTTGQTRPMPWITPATDHEFTPDGRWWTANLIFGVGRELHLFDGLTGEKRKTLSFGGPLYAHFISPDGNREVTVAATDAHGAGPLELRTWTLPELEPLGEPQLVADSVGEKGTFRLTFSPDKSRFLVSTPSGSQVYDLATGTKVGVYVAVAGAGRYLPPRQLPDGRRIATPVAGGVQIWDIATGKPATSPMLHNGEIQSIRCSENGEVLLTTYSDGFARLWDTATGRLLAEPLLEQSAGQFASLSPDGRRLVIGTAGGDVYRLRVGRGVSRPVALPRIAGPATARPDDLARMLWLQRDRAIWIQRDRATVIDAASSRGMAGGFTFPEPIGSLEGLLDIIGTRSDQRFMVVATASGKWQTWELGAAGITRVVALEDAPSGKGWMCISPTGDRVALIADEDRRRIRFWDTRTGKPVGPSCVQYASIPTTGNPGAFSPDGLRFVTGDNAGVATVWDVATGQALLQLELCRGVWIRCVNYSPDGTRIVTADARGTTRLWDAATGRPTSATLHHNGAALSAVFSGDGKYIITSSADRTARVWDGHDGTPVGEPMVHDGGVRSAHFSADGTRVVTASNDGTARVWDVRTGQPLTASMMHSGRVALATFSPEGRFVITVTARTPTDPSTYWLWSVPLGEGDGPAPEWLLRLATVRAAKTVDEAGRCVDVPEVVGQLDAIRRQLAALPKDAPFAEWGRWMLDEGVDRSIAPGLTLTPVEADRLAAEITAPVGAMGRGE